MPENVNEGLALPKYTFEIEFLWRVGSRSRASLYCLPTIIQSDRQDRCGECGGKFKINSNIFQCNRLPDSLLRMFPTMGIICKVMQLAHQSKFCQKGQENIPFKIGDRHQQFGMFVKVFL